MPDSLSDDVFCSKGLTVPEDRWTPAGPELLVLSGRQACDS
jgi:hypothetical protein